MKKIFMKSEDLRDDTKLHKGVVELYRPLMEWVENKIVESLDAVQRSKENADDVNECKKWLVYYGWLHSCAIPHTVWKREEATGLPVISPITISFCEYCNKPYVKRIPVSRKALWDLYHYEKPIQANAVGNQRFCSGKCRDKARYRKLHPTVSEERYCVVCGTPIPAKSRISKQTCSPKCKKKRQRNNKK